MKNNIVFSNYELLLIVLLMIITIVLISVLIKTKRSSKQEIELKERFESLFDNMNEGFALHEIVLDKDDLPIDYIFLEVNKAFEEITQLKEDAIKNKSVKDLLPQTEQYWIDLYAEVAKTGKPKVIQNYSANIGKYFSVNVYSPKQNQFATVFTDITQQINFTKQLSLERKLFETTINSLGDGVISTDEFGNIEIMNPVAQSITGWNIDEAKGMKFEEVFNIIDGKTKKPLPNPVNRVLETGESFNIGQNAIIIRKDRSLLPIEDSVAPIKDSMGNIIGSVIVFRDYSDKKEQVDKIRYLSYHDQLTGLYNRHFFEEELTRLDSLRNLPLSIALLDVNGLKLTNDAFGHKIGDKLLVNVATVLRNICRADDIIARIGGDEFIIILPNTNEEKAKNLVDRIYNALENTQMDNIIVSVSIGYVCKVSPQQSITEIFAKAEENMYRRKLTESPIMRKKTIELILRNLNDANHNEMEHVQKVSELSVRIGEELGLEKQTISDLKIAGLVHDIGKIAINNKIISKSGILTPTEIIEMRRHPEVGYHILKSVDEYKNIADYVLSHHEKWNGSGYPRGLVGENIPIVSRILAIADAFDAMTSDRSYSGIKSPEESIKEIESLAGKDFDPNIIKNLLSNPNFVWL